MGFNQWKACLSAGMMMVMGAAIADSLPVEQIKMPNCLASHLPSSYRTLAKNKDFTIVEIPHTAMDQLSLLADKVHCGRFVNVSDKLSGLQPDLAANLAKKLVNAQPKPVETPAVYEIKHQAEVQAALALVNPAAIDETLSYLSSYYNRSATTQTGENTADWLKFSFEYMASEYGRDKEIATYLVKTGERYSQPSVVAIIGKDIKAPAVIIGAHMDTLDGRMPGADDDGSGSSSVMEVARVLLASKQPLKNPVYIIWYAAEERGLVGSRYVVRDFVKKTIPVKAVMQLDMTGYRPHAEDSTMWVFKDYTDKELNKFTAELIKTYVKVPVDYSYCGYGCSDHASWTDEGFPSTFPCEADFDDHNPYIHTKNDDMAKLSLEHMTNFARLGIAFAIELAS